MGENNLKSSFQRFNSPTNNRESFLKNSFLVASPLKSKDNVDTLTASQLATSFSQSQFQSPNTLLKKQLENRLENTKKEYSEITQLIHNYKKHIEVVQQSMNNESFRLNTSSSRYMNLPPQIQNNANLRNSGLKTNYLSPSNRLSNRVE